VSAGRFEDGCAGPSRPLDRARLDRAGGVGEKKLSRHEAYQLVSFAGQVAVTQLVDKPNVAVHVRLPKSIFVAR
jgi:hypothetical protein